MDRQEFINGLRRGMSGLDDYEYINDTVNYYENYIDSEIRKGETEEAVLRMLGDPSLIAKSIKASRGEVGTTAGTKAAYHEEENDKGEQQNGFWGKVLTKYLSMPSWAIKLTIIAVVVLFLTVLGLIIHILLPVIVVGLVGYVFYKFVKDNFLN